MTQMPWRRIPSLPRDRWGNWTHNASSGCFTRGDLHPAQPCPGEELGEQGARQSLADSRPFKTRDERPESGTQQCITFESQKRPPHWGRGSAGASMSYRGHSPRRHSSAKLARPLASWSTPKSAPVLRPGAVVSMVQRVPAPPQADPILAEAARGRAAPIVAPINPSQDETFLSTN